MKRIVPLTQQATEAVTHKSHNTRAVPAPSAGPPTPPVSARYLPHSRRSPPPAAVVQQQ